MTKETRNRIHLIYGIVFSVVAVIAGILFILSCWNLYQTGLSQNTQPYTVATIAAAFSRIAIPTYLLLVLVLGGWILDLALPIEKKKQPVQKNLPLILERLQAKTDLSACEESLRSSVAKEEKSRKVHMFLSGFLLGLTAVLALIYACNAANWDGTDINGSMIKGFLVTACLLLIPLAYSIFALYSCNKSLGRQIELMRKANAAAPGKGPEPAKKADRQKLMSVARYALLAAAVVFIIYGAYTGGFADVLGKANRICTECIGLG